eukprot:6264330-Amphidinium_carterae.1
MEQRALAGACNLSHSGTRAQRCKVDSAEALNTCKTHHPNVPIRSLLQVYINAFLYAVCFAVQMPVAPYLVKELAGEKDAKVTYGRHSCMTYVMVGPT